MKKYMLFEFCCDEDSPGIPGHLPPVPKNEMIIKNNKKAFFLPGFLKYYNKKTIWACINGMVCHPSNFEIKDNYFYWEDENLIIRKGDIVQIRVEEI